MVNVKPSFTMKQAEVVRLAIDERLQFLLDARMETQAAVLSRASERLEIAMRNAEANDA